jgi:hypothetical protein
VVRVVWAVRVRRRVARIWILIDEHDLGILAHCMAGWVYNFGMGSHR